MEGNVIQINGGITINIDVSVKKVMYVKKKIMSGILVHVIVKMENIQHVLWIIQRLYVLKLQMRTRSRTRKKNIFSKFQKNFNEKKQAAKRIFLYFTCIFINCYSIIDSCQYLLLFDKRLRKEKQLLKFHYANNELKNVLY